MNSLQMQSQLATEDDPAVSEEQTALVAQVIRRLISDGIVALPSSPTAAPAPPLHTPLASPAQAEEEEYLPDFEPGGPAPVQALLEAFRSLPAQLAAPEAPRLDAIDLDKILAWEEKLTDYSSANPGVQLPPLTQLMSQKVLKYFTAKGVAFNRSSDNKTIFRDLYSAVRPTSVILRSNTLRTVRCKSSTTDDIAAHFDHWTRLALALGFDATAASLGKQFFESLP